MTDRIELTAWVVVDAKCDNHILMSSLNATKMGCIARFRDIFEPADGGKEWSKYYDSGYRCIKLKCVEVRDE